MDRREFLRAGVVAASAVACGLRPALGQFVSATEPLRVNARNPRYFTDETGRSIFLTGSHTWANFQDSGLAPVKAFDWEAYLDMMLAHNHNFMRLWAWQQSAWAPGTPDKILFEPTLYLRTGPEPALDGGAALRSQEVQSRLLRQNARSHCGLP